MKYIAFAYQKWVAINVSHRACGEFIAAWNLHHVPGCRGGVPAAVAHRTDQTANVQVNQVPSVEDAITEFTAAGGALTMESAVGNDPLAAHDHLVQQREAHFCQAYPDLMTLFSETLVGQCHGLRDAISYMITLTIQLSQPWFSESSCVKSLTNVHCFNKVIRIITMVGQLSKQPFRCCPHSLALPVFTSLHSKFFFCLPLSYWTEQMPSCFMRNMQNKNVKASSFCYTVNFLYGWILWIDHSMGHNEHNETWCRHMVKK